MTKEFEMFMDWVQINVDIPNDGYVWEYKGSYYTSKQLFTFWQTNINAT